MSTNRRTFIGAASAATAGIFAGNNHTAYAQTSGKGKREPGKLLRIGVLTCHPSHHHMPNIYGPLIQCVPMSKDYTPTRMTGMKLTHMWDHDPKRVETFCEKFGTIPVKRYDDMVDKVDGIMLTDLRAANYFHVLSAPYLKAGIPVFYNRCFTPSVGIAKAVIDLSKKHGTPIIVASGWEFTNESYTLQAAAKQFGPIIRGVTVYNSSNEITHDVHDLWLLLKAVGGGVESVAVQRSVKSVYERGNDTWTIRFKPRGETPGFYATIHNTVSFGGNASVRINFEKMSFEEILPWGANREIRMQYYFIPPLLAFQRILEGQGMEQSYDHILEKTAVFLAGFKSHIQLDGTAALLVELEDDFIMPSDRNLIKLPEAIFD
jgi:hypothetical protein